MNIDKEEYRSIKSEVILHAKNYVSKIKLDQFNKHIEDKLNNFEPTVMVYGTYNAGKSTLLNALFGKDEMAKTGDSPETSEISSYTYNGYTIYDTPGINAPQEHENVTNEHLKKCELILFVLSNEGSFEERYIYEKISDIIILEKPILIVVNNKKGTKHNSQEEKEQIDKININLSKIGDEKGIENIEQRVNICMVNAKTALKAKLENKQLLLDKSNILQLENNINILLKESSSTEVTNALNLYISDFITDTLVQIDSKIDTPEMKKTQELITYLDKLKQRALVELNNIIQESTTIATKNIIELLLSKDQNKITSFVEKTTQDIQFLINTKIKQINEEIAFNIDTFNKEFNEIYINNDDLKLDINTMDNKPVVTNNSNKTIQAVQAGALVATHYIPPVVPVYGFPVPAKAIVEIGIAILSVFSSSSNAYDKAQARLEAKRAEHLSAKNKADEFGFDFKNKLLYSVNEGVASLFDETLKNLSTLASKLSSNNEQLLSDKKALQNILNKL